MDAKDLEKLRINFLSIRSIPELTIVLNDALFLVYKGKCEPLTPNQLYFYADPNKCLNRYSSFEIPKRSGGSRRIHAPARNLRRILRGLNYVLQNTAEINEACTGFCLNKSIVENAKRHLGRNYVLNLDIKDFFFSFDYARVKKAFMQEPFNLKGERQGIADLLAALCTHPLIFEGVTRRVLPQGSPASPVLTNIICKRLDHRLTGLAKRFGAT